VVHSDVALAFFKTLLDRPAHDCRPVQLCSFDIGQSVAEGELELSIREAADVEPASYIGSRSETGR
jgi:hypothetical protein